MITQSPFVRVLTPEPVEMTSKAASLPPMVDGVDVPRAVVKVGFEG